MSTVVIVVVDGGKKSQEQVHIPTKSYQKQDPPSNDVAAGDLAPGRTKTKRIRITIKLLYRPTASVMQREKEHRSQHKQHVKTNWLTCAMRFCSSNLKAHNGDCPTCFLPMPLVDTECTMSTCCSKIICNGCYYANFLRNREEKLDQKCQFCRQLHHPDIED